MAKFYLPERKETSKRWDNNKYVNMLISAMFKDSIADFDENEHRERMLVNVEDILLASQFENVPYGCKTLGQAGCAVFCLEQGLCYRSGGREDPAYIIYLAKYTGDKGYYEKNKGTYHSLLDHYGLRRATHFQEIFDALKMGKLITILVENKKYFEDEANKDSHFVNIVGAEEKKFVIDDSQLGRVYSPMRRMFDATRVAWIW